jgi:hypothetical protein
VIMAPEKIFAYLLTLGFKSPASQHHRGAGSITVWPQRLDCSCTKAHELRLSSGGHPKPPGVGLTFRTHATGHREEQANRKRRTETVVARPIS